MSLFEEYLSQVENKVYRDVDVKRVKYPKGSKVLVIDMDTLIFRVASACQKNYIKVTNKEGKSKDFKHRTEFKEYCSERSWAFEDFTIEDMVEAEPVQNCLAVLKKSVEKLKRDFEIDYVEMYHGGEGNFRLSLPLIEKYKGQRNPIKPVHLKDCIEYAEKHLGSKKICGVETDDIVQMRWLDITEQEDVTCYLGTVDKDAKQVFQSQKVFKIINLASYKVEEFEGGVGKLYLNARQEVKGDGLIWLLFQVMQGDPIDNYAQKKHFKKRYGEKSFIKDFGNLSTPKEILTKFVEVTKRLLPERVVYTAWDGTEVDMSWLETQELFWRCAYMRVEPEDPMRFEDLLLEHGIEY